MAFLDVAAADFKNYGMSRGRSSFTKITGNGGFSASTGIPYGGLLMALVNDITTAWQMYNGDPVTGNEIRNASDLSNITKAFYSQTALSGTGTNYNGSANYGVIVPTYRPAALQHVVLLDSTDAIHPNRGIVSRGVDQSHRIRLEFDERTRLYGTDPEFTRELYQLNVKCRELGRSEYNGGNTINETLIEEHLFDATKNGASADNAHPGYITTGPSVITPNGQWEGTLGIPNPMYGWLKVNIATKNQLLNSGDVSAPLASSDGLITLENGMTVNNSVIRNPGECIDVYFEDSIVPAQTKTITLVTHNTAFENAGVITGTTSGAIGTIDVATSGNPNIRYVTNNTRAFTVGETVTHSTAGTGVVATHLGNDFNRARRYRNKRKGRGWFKRYPKVSDTVGPSYPMSYRITMTERGMMVYLYDDAAADQSDDYAWFCAQRTVDNQTGITRTDEASRFPQHVLYSCSRESVYARDFGVYFSEQAANLQTVENTLNTIYDAAGTSYSVNSIGSDAFYIINTYDREDPLADEFTAKLIWRFVAREFDILKPWDVHKLATAHQTDSNAVLNPLEQLAITDDNRFVITFPTGLTTQRFMYPKEEMDMLCFSSAEVVAEASNVPMTTYKPDGTTSDARRYTGLRATLANGNGMRILALVNGQNILNSDINLD